jgi:hypothetical protein
MSKLIVVIFFSLLANGISAANEPQVHDIDFETMNNSFIANNRYFNVPALLVFDVKGIYQRSYFGKELITLNAQSEIAKTYEVGTLQVLKKDISVLNSLTENEYSYIVITSDICAVCREILDDFSSKSLVRLDASENIVYLNMSSKR